MNALARPLRTHRRGFSLVEVLAVLVVIGVITSIAIPFVSSVNNTSRASAARRNAQVVSSVFFGAKTAGVTLWDASSTPQAIVGNLRDGVSPPDGPFKGRTFIVPNLPADSTAEFAEMMSYLDWDAQNIQLNYNGHF
jgi:prepilin-type N-terminal cleavage/methylation domain-containing protein